MDHKKILTQIRNKEFSPVYFLQSDEPYFIDLIVDEIEKNVLDEAEKAFNQIVLYGKEIDAKQILDQVMQFPMMASHRVVIIKEAQELKDIQNLATYISKPSSQSILVLAHKHKKLDKRKKKIWDALKKNATILDAKKLYDNQIPAYIQSIAQDLGLGIDNNACMLLSEYLGSDLSKVSNEINKLSLNLDKGTKINTAHIQQFIGINKDFNIFELQKAIGMKDKAKAYRIVKYFSQNAKANPMPRNIAGLYGYFTKLFVAKKYQNADNRTLASKLRVNPYFVQEYKQAARIFSLEQIKTAFHQLHLMDKKSKGVDARRADDLGLYQEFIFNIMN
ncbi:MAG: DNA polymerase III subunit delta [Bacteroidia bacterium]|nr:DNA polymerase III subunit delta [Bacteroidia bacterium]